MQWFGQFFYFSQSAIVGNKQEITDAVSDFDEYSITHLRKLFIAMFLTIKHKASLNIKHPYILIIYKI